MATDAAKSATADGSWPDGYSLSERTETSSTNQDALSAIADGSWHDGLVIRANRQSAGRGRRGRQWHSIPGNLLFSIIVDPGCPLDQAAQLSFVAALAVTNSVSNWIGGQGRHQVTCKWPNDVLIDGSKVAGILLEAAIPGSDATSPKVVIGIGVNLAHAPTDVSYAATSIHDTIKKIPTPHAALRDIISAFDVERRMWAAQGFEPVRNAWLARAHRLGKVIAVRLENTEQSGIFAGVDETGALCLETENGVRRILAGDVYFPGHMD